MPRYLNKRVLIIRDDYLWAATVLSSRSFPLRLLSQTTDPLSTDPTTSVSISTTIEINGKSLTVYSNPSDPILIPVMDMLNHNPDQPVTWLTSPDKISFITESSYPPDTEIFNNYGAKGNEECTSPPSFPLFPH